MTFAIELTENPI